MDNLILINIITLVSIALIAAAVLYFVSQKFKVTENPLISEVEACLPQANCGACGKAGCHDFARACVNASAEDFKKLYCPVGGNAVMSKVAATLGRESTTKEETVAVLRCQGSCQNAPDKVEYTGIAFCRIANKISSGRSGCPDGCLRLGDCVRACPFGAISMDKDTGLPVVDENKCTSCGTCVAICPRGLYEIRKKGGKEGRVYVACNNKQKGAIARKNCQTACIACQKCAKICSEIKIENNLSYIPTTVSAEKYGAELAANCPTKAIIYTGKTKEEVKHD